MKKFYPYLLLFVISILSVLTGPSAHAAADLMRSMAAELDRQHYQSGNCTIPIRRNGLSVREGDFEINTTFSNLPKHAVQKAAFMVTTVPEQKQSEVLNMLNQFGDTLIDFHIGYSPQEKLPYLEFKLRGRAEDDSNEAHPIYLDGDTLHVELIRQKNTYYGYYSLNKGPRRLAGSATLPGAVSTEVNYFVRGYETKPYRACLQPTDGQTILQAREAAAYISRVLQP